jgi:hypothetical protein
LLALQCNSGLLFRIVVKTEFSEGQVKGKDGAITASTMAGGHGGKETHWAKKARGRTEHVIAGF